MTYEIKFSLMSESNKAIVSEEDMKFSTDKSIIKTFGIMTASKINYKIHKDGKYYIIRCDSAYETLLKTALIMIYDDETKYRIKFV